MSARVPNVISKRARAENLYALLLNLQARLDHVELQQQSKDAADEDSSGQPKPTKDGSGAEYTYGEYRSQLQSEMARACERDRDLLPLLDGVTSDGERRDDRRRRLIDAREEKEIRELEAELERKAR